MIHSGAAGEKGICEGEHGWPDGVSVQGLRGILCLADAARGVMCSRREGGLELGGSDSLGHAP